MFEIAKSEVGYTGQTPKIFRRQHTQVRKRYWIQQPYVIHEPTSASKADPKDVNAPPTLIRQEIAAGFTSFAIDASHNFNVNAATVKTAEGQHRDYDEDVRVLIPQTAGLEVEVGRSAKVDPKTGERR